MDAVVELARRNALIALPLLALLVLAALYLSVFGAKTSSRRSSHQTVLFVGPLAAGKTALFSKVCDPNPLASKPELMPFLLRSSCMVTCHKRTPR